MNNNKTIDNQLYDLLCSKVRYMRYGDLQLQILKLTNKFWKRVVAFDMETKVIKNQEYLSNERILAIGLAKRSKGELTTRKGVDVKIIFLKRDSEKSEKNLLRKFGKILSEIRPLGVIGYGIRQYDIPLLAIKKQYYGTQLKTLPEFWKIVDFVESTVQIDLYHILKYRGIKKFEEIFPIKDLVIYHF